jgi:coproporphyrinogen III oxidase-like Fe-S oxidoreductase
MVIGKLSNEEIEEILDGIKDEFIEKLYEISREYNPIDFRAAEKLKNSGRIPQLGVNRHNQSKNPNDINQ